MTRITHPADLPADGMITVKPWQGRRRGWHIERVLHPEDVDEVRVRVSPVNIATGEVTGEPRAIVLRFDADQIEAMR